MQGLRPNSPRKAAFTLAEVFLPYYNSPRKAAFTLAEVFLPYYNLPRKVAFTLAEVLITLGIIGVVAAMTLPTLIANYQKQETISKLQKAYTILNQAFKLSEVDNGEFEYWDVDHSDPEAYFEKYWKPYLKIAKMCNTYRECGYTSNNPYTYVNGVSSNDSLVYNDVRRTFYTPDGIVLLISLGGGGGTLEDGTPNPMYESQDIFIDINGSDRPNQYGKDFFRAVITKKGIMPSGYDLSAEEVTTSCSKSGGASYCLSKLMRDGWKIKDDYPW